MVAVQLLLLNQEFFISQNLVWTRTGQNNQVVSCRECQLVQTRAVPGRLRLVNQQEEWSCWSKKENE